MRDEGQEEGGEEDALLVGRLDGDGELVDAGDSLWGQRVRQEGLLDHALDPPSARGSGIRERNTAGRTS